MNTKLMLDRVSDENCDESELMTKHFAKLTLDAPGYTPWFDTWMKLYLQTLPVVEHEFLRHSLGVIFVVSTNSKQPVETFRQLSGNEEVDNTRSYDELLFLQPTSRDSNMTGAAWATRSTSTRTS